MPCRRLKLHQLFVAPCCVLPKFGSHDGCDLGRNGKGCLRIQEQASTSPGQHVLNGPRHFTANGPNDV